ncbi:hypothetical protein LV478_18925 (plasmid) [Komagataeibacter oboediens]|uniref:HipA family kinase n=1 Tax=Komagataeibacter oboediens TaxID=65958 RepID=UPI0023DB4B44|nr:HipA family kinase [Komagataeibacter oboediens]WEQ54083.1 hypothetical protein LV478_18925 [Komagataeibacter oboediens]
MSLYQSVGRVNFLTLLFPLKEIISRRSDASTAVCKDYSRAEDGQWYAIKGCNSGDGNLPYPFYVPHSEWFCQSLCECIGLACPPRRIIERQSKELVFGSRFEGGVDLSNTFGGVRLDWWHYVHNGKIPIDDFIYIFSKLYPFDLFVNNNDRHANNYLVRGQMDGVSFLVFDFSNSWMSNGFPPPSLPMASGSNTIRLKDQFKSCFRGFAVDVQIALDTITSLRQIPSTKIEAILDSHPQEWLSPGDKEIILEWWNSDRNSRLDTIEGGLASGDYL